MDSQADISERLRRAGITRDADPVATWIRLREVEGRRATVIDLYRLAGEARGLEPAELPREERARLASAAAPVFWPGFRVTEGSERFDPIELAKYDPAWASTFTSWRGRIAGALGTVALRIEHVGSTSVLGLSAKPIVDIQVSVADMLDERGYVSQLEALGVQLRSRDDLHRFFRPFAGLPREVHVHVCRSGSTWEREHLLFRDYLRSHRAACDDYEAAKREAALAWRDDGWAYTDAKSGEILSILEAAGSWASGSGWQPFAGAGA